MVSWLDERGGDLVFLGLEEEVTPGVTRAKGVTDNYKVISCFLHVRGREPKVESLVARTNILTYSHGNT